MASLWGGKSSFDEVIEKATSELVPIGSEDIALNLDISDQIRSKQVVAKDAMLSLKRRLGHKNPNVQLKTLTLVDACVKNGGDPFVRQVASREFMDVLADMVRSSHNPDVKSTILDSIQTWGLAAKGNTSLSYMTDTYELLRREGHVFPPVKQNSGSFLLETKAAPEWTDSDVCERCRTPFTMTNRKHHCRNCGDTFCQECSAKSMPLTHLAINEPVRVCDGCYMKLKLAKVTKTDHATVSSRPSHQTQSSSPHRVASQPQVDDSLDEDMKRAIEMSLKEEEQRKNRFGAGYDALAGSQRQPEVQPQAKEDGEEDPDLAAAIAASLRDVQITSPAAVTKHIPNSNDLTTPEKERIEQFSALVKEAKVSEASQIYHEMLALQPKLIRNLDDVHSKHRAFLELHDKIKTIVQKYDRQLEARLLHKNSDYSGTHRPQENSFYPNLQESTQNYPSGQYDYSNVPSQEQHGYPPSQGQAGYMSAPPLDSTTGIHQQQSYPPTDYAYPPTADQQQGYTSYSPAPQQHQSYTSHQQYLPQQPQHSYQQYQQYQPQQPQQPHQPQSQQQPYPQQSTRPAADETPLIDL